MITTIAIAIIVASMGLNCLLALLIFVHRRRIPNGASELPSYPKVSVFIPLRNVDDGLEENLTSVFLIDYPQFDVFLAVDTLEDPCMETIKHVCAGFPHIRSTIVAAGHSMTSNPKINKLSQLEWRSDASLFWVLDSDVRVVPKTLRSLVGEYLKNDARLVFSPIRCGGAESFGSVIEMSYIDFFLSGSVITAWKLLRKRVIVGKSLLIHRKTLDQFGGFAYFADVLAEDYWLGETLAQSGFPVRCNYTWVENIKKTSSVKTYFDRMNRWAKLRFNLNKPLYLSEILLNPFALTLLFVPFLKTAALPFVAVVIVLKTILEYLIFFAVNSGTRPKLSVILSLGPAALVKDMSLLITYALPIFSHTVQWRGGKVHIGKNTVIALNENLLYDGA